MTERLPTVNPNGAYSVGGAGAATPNWSRGSGGGGDLCGPVAGRWASTVSAGVLKADRSGARSIVAREPSLAR